MTTTDLQTDNRPGLKQPVILIGLALWGALITSLALIGAIAAEPGQPPFAMLIAAATPPILFLSAWRLSSGVRAWVAAQDLAMITGIQTWRVIGGVFVFLWALGELPIVFAAPAGLGDVAVGLFAVGVTAAVARRTAGWRKASWALIAAGMIDFVFAIGTGLLSVSGGLLHFAGAPGSDMMLAYPMILIPAYLVPIFMIAHLIAWIKLSTESGAG